MEPVGPRRHPLLVPLLVTLIMVAIVVAGIVVVVVVRSGGEPAAVDPFAGRSAPVLASPSPSPVVADQCVIGVWQVVSYRLRDRLGDGTPVEFVGSGGVTTLRPDGTGEDDYSAGLLLDVTRNAHLYRITILGKVVYRFRTAENRLVQTDVVPNGTTSISDNYKVAATQPLTTTAEPLDYSCAGSTLRISDSKTAIEYRRS